MTLDAGTAAPDFTAPTDGGGTLTLSSLRGKAVILYFYPKDDTPGCTREACAFQESLPDFSGTDATIVGVSKDDAAQHDKFKRKYGLDFPLVADLDGKICEAFGVWVEKLNYGKKYMGIERTTFLIDKQGVIRQIWRKVKVDGHAVKVLEAVRSL
jgi:peroxiredoxin Q/BCP